jgi:hypothetical protein
MLPIQINISQRLGVHHLHQPINQYKQSSHALQEHTQSKSCRGSEEQNQLQESYHNEWQSTEHINQLFNKLSHFDSFISTYITNNLGGIIYVTNLSRDSKNGIRCLFLVNNIQNDLVTLTVDNHYQTIEKMMR